MILRPEGTYKPCKTWAQASGESPNGRTKPVIKAPPDADKKPLRCIIAEVDAKEQTRFAQNNQIVTHTLVQKGRPVAARNWIIEQVGTGRKFWVATADNGGGLHLFTIYYCEELFP